MFSLFFLFLKKMHGLCTFVSVTAGSVFVICFCDIFSSIINISLRVNAVYKCLWYLKQPGCLLCVRACWFLVTPCFFPDFQRLSKTSRVRQMQHPSSPRQLLSSNMEQVLTSSLPEKMFLFVRVLCENDSIMHLIVFRDAEMKSCWNVIVLIWLFLSWSNQETKSYYAIFCYLTTGLDYLTCALFSV